MITATMIRRAIVLGFAGGTLWAFSLVMVAAAMGEDADTVSSTILRLDRHNFPSDNFGALVAQAVQAEFVVITIALIAWVLAGAMKRDTATS
jgi:hypothetical protein